MPTDEERIEEIERRFLAKRLAFRVDEQEDGSWLASYTGEPSPGGVRFARFVPEFTNSTKLGAAAKAWADYESTQES